MDGSERLQPKPNGPLPAPESYESENCGPKPERPGLVAIGTVIEPVPVTGFAANFSPIPRIAPPPLGSEIAGMLLPPELLRSVPVEPTRALDAGSSDAEGLWGLPSCSTSDDLSKGKVFSESLCRLD